MDDYAGTDSKSKVSKHKFFGSNILKNLYEAEQRVQPK